MKTFDELCGWAEQKKWFLLYREDGEHYTETMFVTPSGVMISIEAFDNKIRLICKDGHDIYRNDNVFGETKLSSKIAVHLVE